MYFLSVYVIGMLLFRIYTAPPINVIQVRVTVTIYGNYVLKQTTHANSTLDEVVWLILGEAKYIEEQSKIISSEKMSFAEYLKNQ
jgi:hypothetical protein